MLLMLTLLANVTSIGNVSDLSGQASLTRNGTTTPLTATSTIRQHDIIHTQDNGFVTITFQDNTTLRLGESTRMTIDQYVYDPQNGDGTANIKVSEGFFRFISGNMTKNNPDAMVYRTPVATLGIRGTEAFAEVRPDGATFIGMTDCCVDLSSSTGSVALHSSNTFSKVMKAGDTPSYPTQCPPTWLDKMGKGLGVNSSDRLYGHTTNLSEALFGGIPTLNARYRFEHVSQDNKPDNAHASTLSTRLGYKTGNFYGFNIGTELETVTLLGHQTYNDTENGRTNYPTIPDAETYEINELYFGYEGAFNTHFRVGRQAVNFDNQRFIGSVAFRQDSQTHDAIVISDHHIKDLTATYGYVMRVNRIFSEHSSNSKFDTNSHLLNLHYSGLPNATLAGYGYLLDVTDFPSASTQTYGLRLHGFHPLKPSTTLLYTAEYARQSDYADNPSSFDEPYYHLQAGIEHKALELIAGYEVLSGDGTNSVNTPLATMHAHNGLTDQFTTIPANGLIDSYLTAIYNSTHSNPWLNQWTAKAQLHNFESEKGSIDYGDEWSLGISKAFAQHFTASLTYANYNADQFSTDTEKLWLTLAVRY